MKTGRNEPCPCGSGRKYKQCCLGTAGAQNQAVIDPKLTPAELVAARCRAFQQGDFGFIYDSYHPDSPFRQLYPRRLDYLQQGRGELQRDFRILECRVLKEEIGEGEARVLFYLVSKFQGRSGETFELSRFQRTPSGWRYHSSLKLERGEFSGGLEEIDWADFDRVDQRIRF